MVVYKLHEKKFPFCIQERKSGGTDWFGPGRCGEKEERLTKSETVPRASHTIAADPSVIPLGTRIVIDDVIYTVEDTGKAVKGMRLDIFFDSHEEAVQYGRQEKYVYLEE